MSKKTQKPLVLATPADIEKNCAFFGGHFFSANEGVQSCLWCTATRNSADGDNLSPTGVKAND